MIIEVHRHFKKSYKRRIKQNKQLVHRVKKRIELFTKNPSHPLLKDHKLSGDLKGFRAFWVTDDIRIVYYVKDNVIWLYDIGTHAQVY